LDLQTLQTLIDGYHYKNGRRGEKIIPTFKSMSGWMRKVLESKRRMRKQIAELPFSEKIKILEKLRDRSLAIASNPLRRRPINQG
jgi:hypothetical protein